MSGTWSKLFSDPKLHTLNFDGSHNNQDKKAGAGFIIRDDDGELVIAASYNLTDTYADYCDVAITEAVALRNGLKLAQTYNFKIGRIEGDSKEVYDHVVGNSRRCRSVVLSKIIAEIKSMLKIFENFELINREGNRVADKLASMGSSLPCNSKIYTKYDPSIPSQIAELIEQDKLVNKKKESNLLNGEDSTSGAANIIGVAGAVAGAAMFAAWGVSKLFSGEGSSDENEHTNNENEHTINDLY